MSTTFSIIFETYGRFDTGLKLLSSSVLREILFSIGVKEASLNKVSRNDKLTIFVIIGSTADIHCFRSQVGIGSSSHDLLLVNRMISSISCSDLRAHAEISMR